VHRISDLSVSIGFGCVVVAAAVAYLIRVAFLGRFRSERADADGGSLFVGKPMMEMAFWLLRPLLGVLVSARVPPNAVTWFSLVPAMLGGLALAQGRFALGGVLAALAALCDLLDGTLAKERHLRSRAGALLDAVVDRYSESLLLGGLVFYYRHDDLMLVVTLLALVGSFMQSYTSTRAAAEGVPPPRGLMRRPERRFTWSPPQVWCRSPSGRSRLLHRGT